MARIIDGKAIAREIRAAVRDGVASLGPPAPLLVAVEVGHDPASASYTRSQAKTAAKLGIEYRLDSLPADAGEAELERHLGRLAADDAVCAIMLQMPLPAGLDETRCRRFIAPDKDVEAVTETAAGRVLYRTYTTAPCTALAALRCLEAAAPDGLEGLDVAIVGRSAIVGRPLALLLTHANATVTVCHTRTRDLADKLRRADAVVAAAGRPGLITRDMVREGALVVDVGTSWIEDEDGSHLAGDVAFDEVAERAGAITPVPGGVGPVTVAILMQNVLELARRQRGA